MRSARKRIIGLDILRVLCLIFIFCYHYFVEYVMAVGTVPEYIGNIMYFFNIGARPASILLFVISGYALIYNGEEALDIPTFFKRRFKSLFLPFYVCYGIMYISTFLIRHQLLGVGLPKIRFIYTLMGIDALMFYHEPTFYLVGEWFMGNIVICYILFPLLAAMLKKVPRFTLALFIVWYMLLLILPNPIRLAITNNPFFNLVYFYIGMFLRKYLRDTKISTWFTALCAVFSIAVYAIFMFIANNITFVNIKPDSVIGEILNGLWSLAMLIAVLNINIKESSMPNRLVSHLAGISWYILLVHHVIIGFFYVRLPITTYSAGYIFALFPACVLISYAVGIIARKIVKLAYSALKFPSYMRSKFRNLS